MSRLVTIGNKDFIYGYIVAIVIGPHYFVGGIVPCSMRLVEPLSLLSAFASAFCLLPGTRDEDTRDIICWWSAINVTS